ncbi:MAG: NADH-quinone oxidoreductase subunit J [Geminicoccaceae bacterium]|nr:NADH-quinone oxidoreductase subunit J [Geminicoccaceae bacterium]
MQLLLFYILALVCTASAVMVIASRNPVHSVLYLILAFFNAAGLFVLIGAEFLAMVLVVVYVGAVAVLFLFVVMMLDINFVEMREGFLQYLPVGALVGIILLVELMLVGGSWALADRTEVAAAPATVVMVEPAAPVAVPPEGGETAVVARRVRAEEVTNTQMLGAVLYTEYFYLFQAAGAILLVAIVGAITLTLRERPATKRQDIGRQVRRRPFESVELRKVKPRAGI